MIKIAFCDDDLCTLNEINGLLDLYRLEHQVEMVSVVFYSPLELLAEIEKGLRPDILFLDIIMPGEDGISVAKEIRQYNEAVKIIFLTTSPEFAVESYTVGAYFYQMKPICTATFFQLLDSVIAECEETQHCSLVLRRKNGVTRIQLEKLIYCEVIGRTLMFHLENEKVLESVGCMDELCKKLVAYENFVRPHRSFLVNMEYISSISNKTIKMDNQAEIPIPHGRCTQIKNQFLAYASKRKQVLML